jgi:D-alanyl-D-alanine-carboxypeptidase/D-alanyl-D-alanine-endopeptidase
MFPAWILVCKGMKKCPLLITLLICASKLVTAQHVDSVVKRAADHFMAGGSRVGFSVGIIKTDQVYKYHFGSVNKGGKTAPTDETIYEIGSVTKTFTSMLLAQAVIEGKVKLDDDIRKYLKGNYPNLQYQGKPIRLLHLANLTSGLPNNLPEQMPPMKTMSADSQIFEIRNFHDTYTSTQFLADLHTVKLTRQPGLNPAHSNTAAELLGFLLENIYGLSYQALVSKYITGPLKMASKKALCAPGYNDKGVLMPVIPKDAGSAGILRSSLADMVTYMGVQLREKNKAAAITHKPTWGNPETEAIGLNWWSKTNFDSKTKIWASGGTFGHSCYIVLYPGREFGVVILTNENDNQAEDGLAGMAEAIYNDISFTPAQRSAEGFGFSAAINTLLDALNKAGFENAVTVAADLKKNKPGFKLIEDELNSWGYRYFFKNEKAKALEIFKLNVALYPQSANTYDSLAETYEAMGDKAQAIKNYKRDLELNPGNQGVAEHLKKLEEGK